MAEKNASGSSAKKKSDKKARRAAKVQEKTGEASTSVQSATASTPQEAKTSPPVVNSAEPKSPKSVASAAVKESKKEKHSKQGDTPHQSKEKKQLTKAERRELQVSDGFIVGSCNTCFFIAILLNGQFNLLLYVLSSQEAQRQAKLEKKEGKAKPDTQSTSKYCICVRVIHSNTFDAAYL